MISRTKKLHLAEYLGTQLGVSEKLTPKIHAGLAGEGVE
jgi:hypothetical protein